MLALRTRNLIAKVQPKLIFNECKRTMAIVPFKLADIGEGIAEVELMKWFVKEGDKVKSFDRICEVQSDKATVEITSRFGGVIAKVHHAEGDIVKVGAALIDIETGVAATPAATATPAAPAAPAAAAQKPAAAAAAPTSHTTGNTDHTVHNDKVLTTPAVRKIAKENNVNLSQVPGTGPKGRVLKEDILLFVQNKANGIAHTAATSNNTSAGANSNNNNNNNNNSNNNTAAAAKAVVDMKVPIRGVQRMMVKSMTAALQVQHLTYCEEIQFDALKQLRAELKSSLAKKNIKLSYMPLMIKAASLALTQYPQLNATVNAEVTEITQHGNHNIGVAMDTPKGLVVPVLKAVQSKSLVEIAVELTQLQEAAMNGTITEAQLSGGTFTISNIGSVGGTYAVPVLVVPQVLIGAFGRLQVLPRYVHKKTGKNASVEEIEDNEAEVKPVTIMNVSWSADHRVVDGATVAKFSNVWKRYLEHPSVMLADMR